MHGRKSIRRLFFGVTLPPHCMPAQVPKTHNGITAHYLDRPGLHRLKELGDLRHYCVCPAWWHDDRCKRCKHTESRCRGCAAAEDCQHINYSDALCEAHALVSQHLRAQDITANNRSTAMRSARRAHLFRSTRERMLLLAHRCQRVHSAGRAHLFRSTRERRTPCAFRPCAAYACSMASMLLMTRCGSAPCSAQRRESWYGGPGPEAVLIYYSFRCPDVLP